MLVLDAFRLERRRSGPAGGRAGDDERVRLLVPGIGELANDLQRVRFEEDPVEWILCEECARYGCGSGAHARVTRTASHLLLTPPDPRRSGVEIVRTHPLVLAHGAVALELDRWIELQDAGVEHAIALPLEHVFAPAGPRELWAAWVAPLPPLLRRLDPRAFPLALARSIPPRLRESQRVGLEAVLRLSQWFRRGASEPGEAGLVAARFLQTEVRSIVLDERHGDRWSAFAEAPGGELYPLFGPDLALLADPPPARAA